MVSKYRRSGWFLEPTRHSLASQGIKTGRKVDYSTHRQRKGALIGGVAGLLVAGPIGAVAGAGTGYVVGSKKKKRVNYGRQLSSSEFRIDDNTTIVCRSENTSYGFRHIADLYRNGSLVDSAKATYQNRTWESYEFESVINNLVDKMNISSEEKNKIKSNLRDKAHGKVESQFKTVAMVASLGEVFGKSQKEKNDWKLRMIKAGLGSKGFEVPEDWETLSEDEKGKRLDNIIKFMNEEKSSKSK